MNKIKLGFIAISMFLIGIVAVPSAIYAQSAQDVQNGQGTQNDTGTLNTNDIQTGAANDDRFNWMWLLPLLAIPIIYLMTRKGDDQDKYREQNTRMAGTKGGRSRNEEDDGYEQEI